MARVASRRATATAWRRCSGTRGAKSSRRPRCRICATRRGITWKRAPPKRCRRRRRWSTIARPSRTARSSRSTPPRSEAGRSSSSSPRRRRGRAASRPSSRRAPRSTRSASRSTFGRTSPPRSRYWSSGTSAASRGCRRRGVFLWAASSPTRWRTRRMLRERSSTSRRAPRALPVETCRPSTGGPTRRSRGASWTRSCRRCTPSTAGATCVRSATPGPCASTSARTRGPTSTA